MKGCGYWRGGESSRNGGISAFPPSGAALILKVARNRQAIVNEYVDSPVESQVHEKIASCVEHGMVARIKSSSGQEELVLPFETLEKGCLVLPKLSLEGSRGISLQGSSVLTQSGRSFDSLRVVRLSGALCHFGCSRLEDLNATIVDPLGHID